MSVVMDKNVLNDILADVNENKDSIFKTYKPKGEIADAILNKFLERGKKRGQKLFYLSDTNKKSGLLSVAQGLVSLTLILQMEDLKSENINNDCKIALGQNILEMLRLIGYEDENSELHFYATPFVDEKEQNINDDDEEDDDETINYYDYDYVDAICKTMQAIIECRELISIAIDDNNEIGIYSIMQSINNDVKNQNIYNKTFVNQLKSDKDLVNVLENCLTKSIDRLLKLKINNVSDIKNVVIGNVSYDINCIGWNFTNQNYSSNALTPSLFFTYCCTQAYMTFYKNFVDALNHWRNNIPIEENNLKLVRDYNYIIKYQKLIDEFRNAVRSCGLYLDEKIKNLDLRSKFLGLDYSVVDMNEIKNSTTNNALFNSIFAVAILIGSGTSDLYEEAKAIENRRYFEWLQSIMQNIYESYCDLLSIRKDYAISQYILNFNEMFPADLAEFANYLRKQRIQVLSIVPTMTRVYNMVSTYLINYPQKQMGDYLILLMNNRRLDNNGNPEWSWDRDNYDVNINTIYIGAIYDFYLYYENFERQYIETDRTISELNQKIRDKELEGEEKLSLQAQKHLSEIAKLNEEKKQINDEKENTPLNLAIRNLIHEEMSKELYSSLYKIFDEVSEYLCQKDKPFMYGLDNSESKESIFANKLALMLFSYFRSTLVKDVAEVKKEAPYIDDKVYQSIIRKLCYELVKNVENLSKEIRKEINTNGN